MWSLPDIQRLNRERLETAKKLEYAVRTGVLDGKTLRCECGKNDKNCRGPLEHNLWYDIYSDSPRGIITQCEFHRTRFGRPENFFCCHNCERWVTKCYTYHLPFEIDKGWPICMQCAAKRYVENEENWIALRDEDICAVTFSVIQCARHVLDVCMPSPDAPSPVARKIQLFDRVPLDSETFGLISGFGFPDPTPDSAVEMIRNILEEARDAGYDRALLVIDGVFQCAFTVGVYVWRVPAAMDPKQRAGGEL